VSPERLRSAFKAGAVKPVADTAPPNLTIDEGPRGALSARSFALRWGAADDTATPEAVEPNAITYSHRLTGAGRRDRWSAWSAATTVRRSRLAAGDYVFEVRARDTAGNTSSPVARRIELRPAG